MWNAISNLGDAALTVPIAIMCAAWLWLSSRILARRWVMLLAGAMALVGLTKILYAGCGFEISSIGFRVISGHTTLSTAVWTVAFTLVFRGARGDARIGTVLGLIVGLMTAIARVFDNAHTIPEVIVGWLLGALIAGVFVRKLGRSGAPLFRPAITSVVLLLVTSLAYGRHAPIQSIIEQYSHDICLRTASRISSFF